MATAIKSVGPNWTAVAVGPGNATFQMSDEPGEWTIHSASSGAPAVQGIKAEREKAVSMALASGEYLHLRGRGSAVVTADTLV